MIDFWGRANRYAFNLSEALAKQDLELTVATLDDSASIPSPGYQLRAIIPTFASGGNPFAKLLTYLAGHRMILREARAVGVEIVHIQYVRRAVLDLLLFLGAKMRGFKVVYTAHNVLPHERRWYHRLLFKALYRLCDHVIVTSDAAARQVQSQFGIGEDRLTTIPIGHTGPTELRTPSREEARAALDIPSHAMFLLNFGGIRPYKGIDTLLQATAEIQTDLPNLQVFIGGPCWESDLLHQYTETARERGLDERVRIRGEFIPDEEALRYMAAADLVVLPYHAASGHSAVMMMAFYVGRPVVATRVGGLEEAMVDGETGYLVLPGDADALAQAIKKALADPKELERMGKMAKARLNDEYSWKTIAKATAAAYQHVLTKRTATK